MSSARRSTATLVVLSVLAVACANKTSSETAPAIVTLRTQLTAEHALESEPVVERPDSRVAADGEVALEDAQLDFSQCMRDNGYSQWPDPPYGVLQGAQRQVDIQALGIDHRAPEFRETIRLCRQVFEGVAGRGLKIDPEQRAEIEDRILQLIACIRSEPGFENVTDPDFSAGLPFRQAVRQVFATGEWEPDKVRVALSACRNELGLKPAGPGQQRQGGVSNSTTTQSA